MTGVALAVGLFIGFGIGFIFCNIRDIEMFRECDRMLEKAEKAIKEAEDEI
jgi:hypothetical protein